MNSVISLLSDYLYGSTCVTYNRTLSKDKSTATFTCNFALNKDPLIEINQQKHVKNIIKLQILSSDVDQITVIGTCSSTHASYLWEKNLDCSVIHVPFLMNSTFEIKGESCTTEKTSDSITKVRKEYFRGNNSRVCITLKEPIEYKIIIPTDADLRINLDNTNVIYSSTRPTLLHVESSSVNYPGNFGTSSDGKECWDYKMGSDNSPLTDIFTNGFVHIGTL